MRYFRVILSILIIFIPIAIISQFFDVNHKHTSFNGFTFEDYKTEENAQEALLKLHPIGSETKALLDRFKKLEKSTHDSEDGDCKTIIGMFHKGGVYNSSGFDKAVWVINIHDNNGKIQFIYVTIYLEKPKIVS